MTLSDLIDKAVLRDLLDQLSGDLGGSRVFVENFVGLWDTRSRRLTCALDESDPDEAHIVLLSIASSCAMVGAIAVCAIAGVIDAAVVFGDFAEARRHLVRLEDVATRTLDELSAMLASWGPRALAD
ncbi:hypothetical protein [Compostimonas suwonensis]|uniref:Hpt domain-containing protein n=1 Tax=Compostimonas suwonensis TaxID=1048394 RepID=A0A2M9BCD8_9MICO|nr:hypothetical protein [Compostimonas suwonensis]PJJ55619.1 hypothetical protein CLV54_2966 [Compostimonas suwonensis]